MCVCAYTCLGSQLAAIYSVDISSETTTIDNEQYRFLLLTVKCPRDRSFGQFTFTRSFVSGRHRELRETSENKLSHCWREWQNGAAAHTMRLRDALRIITSFKGCSMSTRNTMFSTPSSPMPPATTHTHQLASERFVRSRRFAMHRVRTRSFIVHGIAFRYRRTTVHIERRYSPLVSPSELRLPIINFLSADRHDLFIPPFPPKKRRKKIAASR